MSTVEILTVTELVLSIGIRRVSLAKWSAALARLPATSITVRGTSFSFGFVEASARCFCLQTFSLYHFKY